MSTQKKPCIFGCHRLAGGKGDICSTCKSGLRYWDDKDHSHILKREEHLEVLSARMHRIASTRKPRTKATRTTRAAARHEARA